MKRGTVLIATASLAGLIAVWAWRKRKWAKAKQVLPADGSPPKESVDYDVLICGAGPAGATAAFYLAKLGVARVALLDKKTFPRPKPCGDAWCKPALDLLDEMGILAQMEHDGVVYPVKRGGFISPFGYECVNTDGSVYGAVTGCKTYAIKRQIADNYLVQANKKLANVSVLEDTEVQDVTFVLPRQGASDNDAGHYVVKTGAGSTLTATFVFICDGSTSYMAQKLGLLPKGLQSQATCSHAYIKNHTWPKQAKKSADGVMVFNKAVLPGYSALFRHADDNVYLGTYILPGGMATSRAIAPFEGELVLDHPYVANALGAHFDYEERRVVAPIRCGGGVQSFAKQLLVVGDAAGHVDPLTGEGIHTAMMAGKLAAGVAKEMIDNKNYSVQAASAYEKRCYDAFGFEFWSSSICAAVIVRMPIALDAMAVVGARRGQAFLDFFGECMTGVRPKSEFVCDVGLLLELGLEIGRQVYIQHILGTKPLVPQDIGQAAVDKQAAK